MRCWMCRYLSIRDMHSAVHAICGIDTRLSPACQAAYADLLSVVPVSLYLYANMEL